MRWDGMGWDAMRWDGMWSCRIHSALTVIITVTVKVTVRLIRHAQPVGYEGWWVSLQLVLSVWDIGSVILHGGTGRYDQIQIHTINQCHLQCLWFPDILDLQTEFSALLESVRCQ